ncbi:hypothetical protein BN871_GE_00100 [Paenibacillus sp. P22]|nr:hypothetical protein BN871_GE_00100 [Paenibacillus sp. P22]
MGLNNGEGEMDIGNLVFLSKIKFIKMIEIGRKLINKIEIIKLVNIMYRKEAI